MLSMLLFQVAPVPVDSTAAISQVGSVITSSAIIAYTIQTLKKSRWFPWISDYTVRLNHLVAAALSLLAAWGVHAHFDSATHTLTVSNLCTMCVLSGIWDWAKSYVTTRLIYDVAIGSSKTGDTVPVVSASRAAAMSEQAGVNGKP